MAKKSVTSVDDAPTSGDLLGLYQARLTEGDEAKLRSRAKLHRQLTEMEHAVTIPPEYCAIAKEIRTPYVRDTWLRVTAALTRDTPVAHVEARNGTGPARDAANIAERFFMATMQTMSRERGEDLLYEDVKGLVRDAEAVIKCVHKPDAWATFPKRTSGENADAYQSRTESYKKSAALPFGARVVDRLAMLIGDGEYGDEWALEYGEYPTPYLKRRYKMTLEDSEAGTGYYVQTDTNGSKVAMNRRRLVDPKGPASALGGKPFPEGDLATSAAGMSVKLEYFDADTWCVAIDGSMAPGFPRPNPYSPWLPYFRAKADPVLFALSFLVPGFDALLTMWLNWAYLGAYPTPQLKAPASAIPGIGDVGGELEPIGNENKPAVWHPGKQIEPPPGYELGFVQPPPIGQDVQQMAQIYRQLIETAGVSSILRGAAGSDASGYLANQLIAAATLTYKHLGRAVESQLAQLGEFMWHVVDKRIKQEVYVLATEGSGSKEEKSWLGLKPSGRLSGLCAPVDLLARMDVKLRPMLPTDEQARSMIAVQLTNAPKPLLSRATAIERHLQIEDPEGELDKIAVEDALDNDPMLKTLQTTEALRKAGYLPQPQSGLLDQFGKPMVGQSGQMNPLMIPGGQAAGGLPGIPGLTQPMTPGPPPQPNGVLLGNGGRAAGSYPGQPGNQGPP